MSNFSSDFFLSSALAPSNHGSIPIRTLLGKRSPSPQAMGAAGEGILHKRLATANDLTARASLATANVDWFADSVVVYQRRRAAELNALASLQAANTARVLPTTTHSALLNSTAIPGRATLSPRARGVAMLLQARREAPSASTAALLNLFPSASAAPAPTPHMNSLVAQANLRRMSAQMTATASPGMVALGDAPDPVGLSLPQTARASPNPLDEEVARSKLPCMPLASEEDHNWLSEFHTFVRNEIVEVCFATADDVAARNISQQVFLNQVGIRCKCCADMNPAEKAPRAMAFPSSIAQIYQSFTMMLREHFTRCSGMPEDIKEKIVALKQGKTAQGATNSKEFWEHSAKGLGMRDTEKGIIMTERTRAAAKSLLPYGADAAQQQLQKDEPIQVIFDDEKEMAQSDYNFTLLRQVQRVHLHADECRGNRKTLQVGLPGLACKHCSLVGRMGQSRVFPVKKRTLSTKLEDMYQHLMRCTVCPSETKELLKIQRPTKIDFSKERKLYSLVWTRVKKNPDAGRPRASARPAAVTSA
ncbi:expressed unknown protein [Seminavis robusta]|uniref:Uncharacterized protein n=1 Tax=Seminavis robusta TaxID=568900 RepID=A0A9N8EWE7_9STRA|nr:expressed unknown protein [Seminavis robusta]|eukprot:Sro2123_g315560.1 n/a (533) ;mRNA; r:8150-9833